MVRGTHWRVLLLALAWTPACASGAGVGEAATDTSTGTASSSSGTSEAATTSEPTGPDSTGEPDPSSSTTEVPTTGETTVSDTSSSGAEETTTGPELLHPELYPTDRIHSPITAYVADNLRTLAAVPAGADKDPHVFAKIGGSSTASTNFMQCFTLDATIQSLPAEPSLPPTIAYFRMADLGGVTSFNRTSVAAKTGFDSDDLAAGMTTLVDAEVAAIKPRFAQLLIGTHDLEHDQTAQLWTFADNLLDTVDDLLTAGVVPILSTIPQRPDLPAKDVFVPRYNAVVRAIAQGRQIPLVDVNLALAGLPMTGVLADGELSVFVANMADRPCHFTDLARTFGHNVRNLEGLRALDRARQVVVDEVPELDPPGPPLQGVGSMSDPIAIPSLPFVDLRSTADSASDVIDVYTGDCDPLKDESGPERFYRLEVAAPIDVRIFVFDRGAVDVDIHVLGGLAADMCMWRNDRAIAGSLAPGTYYIVVDSFAGNVPDGAAGEYALVVMAD